MKSVFNRWRHELILLAVIFLEWSIFACLGPNFSSAENSHDIFRHSVEIGLLALAMTPIILAGGIDLSAGSVIGLCAILFGKCWRDYHWPLELAAASAIFFGVLAGSLNGWLITRVRLSPLIVTLGTFSLFRGLAEAITRGVDTFTNFPDRFLFWGQEQWLGMPAQASIFILLALFFWVWVHQTTAGRCFRAIGFSSEGARYAGLRVDRQTFIAYAISGGVAAVAALIYTARVGQARADAGTGYELLAITAVVLGGTSIFGGKGSIPGTLLGVAAIAILNNGLVHARQPREAAGIFTGLLLLLALALPNLRRLKTSWRTRNP